MQEAGDFERTRQLSFTALPPGQAKEAAVLLDGLPHLDVISTVGDTGLLVRYDLRHYNLQKVETALTLEGFHLDNSLLIKLKRAWAHYCESTQAQYLGQPDARERSRRIYAEVYQHHSHGDHDDTPPELRSYR